MDIPGRSRARSRSRSPTRNSRSRRSRRGTVSAPSSPPDANPEYDDILANGIDDMSMESNSPDLEPHQATIPQDPPALTYPIPGRSQGMLDVHPAYRTQAAIEARAAAELRTAARLRAAGQGQVTATDQAANQRQVVPTGMVAAAGQGASNNQATTEGQVAATDQASNQSQVVPTGLVAAAGQGAAHNQATTDGPPASSNQVDIAFRSVFERDTDSEVDPEGQAATTGQTAAAGPTAPNNQTAIATQSVFERDTDSEADSEGQTAATGQASSNAQMATNGPSAPNNQAAIATPSLFQDDTGNEADSEGSSISWESDSGLFEIHTERRRQGPSTDRAASGLVAAAGGSVSSLDLAVSTATAPSAAPLAPQDPSASARQAIFQAGPISQDFSSSESGDSTRMSPPIAGGQPDADEESEDPFVFDRDHSFEDASGSGEEALPQDEAAVSSTPLLLPSRPPPPQMLLTEQEQAQRSRLNACLRLLEVDSLCGSRDDFLKVLLLHCTRRELARQVKLDAEVNRIVELYNYWTGEILDPEKMREDVLADSVELPDWWDALGCRRSPTAAAFLLNPRRQLRVLRAGEPRQLLSIELGSRPRSPQYLRWVHTRTHSA